MAMFDYLTIDYPLPINSYIPDRYKPYIYAAIDRDGFQTKDLECLGLRYHIDKVGRIFCAEVPDFESDKDPDYKKIYQHGHISAYTVVYLDENGKDFFLEYDLKFTDSLLIEAKMIYPTEGIIDELHRDI